MIVRAFYRVLASLVALGVVVQAAAVGAAAAGGLPVHALVGGIVLPALAVALLAASAPARVRGAVGSAVVVVVLTGVQVGLGHATGAVPLLGALHGATALLLFAAALGAARRARPALVVPRARREPRHESPHQSRRESRSTVRAGT